MLRNSWVLSLIIMSIYLTYLIQALLILTISLTPLLFVENKNSLFYKSVGWIVMFFCGYNLALQIFPHMSFNWNWPGKIACIIWSLAFISLCPLLTFKNCRFTLHQAKNSFKSSLLIMVILCVITIFTALVFDNPVKFDFETLAFQLTMPGIDEEIANRGILLSLLTQICPEKLKLGKLTLAKPAVIMSALIFALGHVIIVNKIGQFQFEWINFTYTFIFGVALAWCALVAQSLVMPMVIHNTTNTLGQIIRMLRY